MGNHLTSITLKDIPRLEEPRQTYLDLLLFDEKEVRDKIDNSTPVVKVFLTRLEARQKFFDSPKRVIPVLESLEFSEIIVEEKNLYDLGDLERAMCLTIGRFSHNHFRPFLNEDAVDMDPFVSREHGLIFLNEKRHVCYHDIGTFKKGSTNGTKLNDITIVKNEILSWERNDYFGLGESQSVLKANSRLVESKFKLRFERLDN